MKAKKITVFIVDDEPLLAEMLSDFLHEDNPRYNIKSFLTGEACLREYDESPSAIVLDYYLNSKDKSAANGDDILIQLKKIYPLIPVIMLSSQESYGVAAKTIMHGAVHYVIKGKDAFSEINDLLKANIAW